MNKTLLRLTNWGILVFVWGWLSLAWIPENFHNVRVHSWGHEPKWDEIVASLSVDTSTHGELYLGAGTEKPLRPKIRRPKLNWSKVHNEQLEASFDWRKLADRVGYAFEIVIGVSLGSMANYPGWVFVGGILLFVWGKLLIANECSFGTATK